MRFLSFLALFSLLFMGCSTGVPGDTEVEPMEEESSERLSDQYPVIYVSVFTHAEQANGKETPDFVADEDAFWEQRQLVVDFAQMLYEKGVTYDYQSDWNFLEAALKYDSGTEDTNGKNFLQYLGEDLNASIDPHNHTGQSEYNYADVAYLIEQLGVEPSGVVGGYIAAPVDQSVLEELWEPIEGAVYDYTWTPEILWGGGTGNHINDEALRVSGMWRPQDSENWSTHDPDAPLAVVGNYSSDWEGLDELLSAQDSGELEQGKMYTVSIDAHQKKLSEEFIEEFARQIDEHQAYADEGRLVWSTIPAVYETWVDRYDESPSQYFELGSDQWGSGTDESTSELKGDGSFIELKQKNKKDL